MKNLLYIPVLILFISCSKVIDMDIDNKTPKLVINAWLQPDSIVKVHVSKSIHILENGEKPILVENAQVNLFENNIKIESLHYTSEGFYASDNFIPKNGNSYKIEASSSELGTVTAECTIPDTIQIDKITTSYSSNDSKQTININFTDKGNETNYYMVYIENENQYATPEKYYYNSKIMYSTNCPFVELAGNWSILGDFYHVENETGISSNNNLSASAIVFSDNLFNGSSSQIELKIGAIDPNVPAYKEEQKMNKVIVSIVSISKDYYQYISSYKAGDTDPFTEREQTYCNIKNGFGILLSSNSNRKLVSFSGK